MIPRPASLKSIGKQIASCESKTVYPKLSAAWAAGSRGRTKIAWACEDAAVPLRHLRAVSPDQSDWRTAVTEMVEKVARAIMDARSKHRLAMFNKGGMELVTSLPEPRDEIIARAAIEAMREPTGGMAGAGQAAGSEQVKAHYVVGFPATPVAGFMVHGEVAIWQGMIDAALAE